MIPSLENSSRSQRQTRDRELRRQDFLDAAERVFARRGYHDAGMDEIAEEAGYAIGTVYRYFTSKKDLYHTLLESKALVSQMRTRQHLESKVPAMERIQALVRDELDFVRQHQEFLRVLVAEVMKGEGDLSEGCRRLRAEHLKNFIRVIEDGVTSGEFRVVDQELTAILLCRLVETLFHEILGHIPAGQAFEQRLATVEAFILETANRLLLPS